MQNKISKMNDRELLVLILSNQVAIMQLVDRLNSFFLKEHGADYGGQNKHKTEILKDLIDNQEDLLRGISDRGE